MSGQTELRQRGEHAKQQGKQEAHKAKEQAHSTAQDLQHQAEVLLHQGEVKAHQLANQIQANPRLQTGLLVLSAFILGIALTGMAGKMGVGPAAVSWKYTDPASLQAHQQLDVLLEQAFEAKRMGGEKLKMATDKATDLKEQVKNMDKADIAKQALKTGAKAYMGLGLKDVLTEGVRSITNKMLGREEHVPTMGEKIAAAGQQLKDKITGNKPADNSLHGKINQAQLKLQELLHAATGL